MLLLHVELILIILSYNMTVLSLRLGLPACFHFAGGFKTFHSIHWLRSSDRSASSLLEISWVTAVSSCCSTLANQLNFSKLYCFRPNDYTRDKVTGRQAKLDLAGANTLHTRLQATAPTSLNFRPAVACYYRRPIPARVVAAKHSLVT